jgi:AbrB family looped-hinge helix DNA binding protein
MRKYVNLYYDCRVKEEVRSKDINFCLQNMIIPYTYTIPVSSKGQITIPAEVRQVLGIKRPGKVTIQITSEKEVKLSDKSMSLDDVLGSIKGNDNTKNLTVEEMVKIAQIDKFKK